MKVDVYIEIEKGSNIKYEFDKSTNKLVIDRILPEHYYPYAYGFIENTRASDGDELDALIITHNNFKNDYIYNVYIVGVLIMEDEKGLDEKILCMEYDFDLDDIHEEVKEEIFYFFTNYKNNSPGKWSKVYDFKNKEYAIDLYNKYLSK